jgi:hypothetical protein
MLWGRRQAVTALSVHHASAFLLKSLMFRFGVELMARGSWQTRVRPVPEVSK